MTRLASLVLIAIPLLVACAKGRPVAEHSTRDEIRETTTPPRVTRPSPVPNATESAHHVVFADRTSYAYLLLVDHQAPLAPTRDELKALVRKGMAGHESEQEVELLLDLIDRPPPDDERAAIPLNQAVEELADAKDTKPPPDQDLLGLHVNVLAVRSDPEKPLITSEILEDPILTRELTDKQRASLPQRDHAILLRAVYRNQHGVRGLRLLQSLVRLVALEHDALIHDWDTGETMGVDTFTQRRLQAALGNVADQIVVVPFSDTRFGPDFVRLSTRGMRRFGSPDLELDGLPKEPRVLQSATHFLLGLAFLVTRQSEVHPSGLAVEAEETLTVHYRDVQQAYSGRKATVPRCAECEESVLVHLVERPAKREDPRGHPVVRVVAPRQTSDRADYDHPAWAVDAIAHLLGP